LNENQSSEEFRKKSLKLLILFLQNSFYYPEFEENLQDSLPLLFNSSQNQEEEKLLLEIALLLSLPQFLIDACHSIFTYFTIVSPLIISDLKYFLSTESF
jgi:hypothetical protein